MRVVGLRAPAVEEVLGIVDHALAGTAQELDRFRDHPQVLAAVNLDELLEVERPGLADDRADRRDRVRQQDQRRVLAGGHVTPAGHPERGDLRATEALRREQLEELPLLRVRCGEAGLDQLDAELVERVRHAQLLLCRE